MFALFGFDELTITRAVQRVESHHDVSDGSLAFGPRSGATHRHEVALQNGVALHDILLGVRNLRVAHVRSHHGENPRSILGELGVL